MHCSHRYMMLEQWTSISIPMWTHTRVCIITIPAHTLRSTSIRTDIYSPYPIHSYRSSTFYTQSLQSPSIVPIWESGSPLRKRPNTEIQLVKRLCQLFHCLIRLRCLYWQPSRHKHCLVSLLLFWDPNSCMHLIC